MDSSKLPNGIASDARAAIICSNNSATNNNNNVNVATSLLSSAVLEVPSNFAENLNIYSDLLDRCKLAASHSSIFKSLYLKSSTTKATNLSSDSNNNNNNKNNKANSKQQRTSFIIATTSTNTKQNSKSKSISSNKSSFDLSATTNNKFDNYLRGGNSDTNSNTTNTNYVSMGKSNDEAPAAAAAASSSSPNSINSLPSSSNNNNARFIKSIALNKLNSYNTLLTNKSNNFYSNTASNNKKSINGKSSNRVLVKKPFLLEASGVSVNNSMDNKLSFRASLKPNTTKDTNNNNNNNNNNHINEIESNAPSSGNNTQRPLTVGPFRPTNNSNEMSIYTNDTNSNVKTNNNNSSNLPPILGIKNGKFTNLIRNTKRPDGRRSGASDGCIGKSRIRDRSNPRIIQFYNNTTVNNKSNSDGSSSSANAKNRNFISFLAMNQQNEKKRLKSQISKMCSISFKKLNVAEDSTTTPCVIKNSNYTRSNLINLSDFTTKFESLDLNQKDNGDDDEDVEGGEDDLRKISILNNYFSNSILSNYNSNVNNDATGKNDESNLNTQRTSNNYNNSTSFIKNRPESLLSDRCKSEGFDEEIQYDNDNDNENYFDM
jgi:hypothetical protein